MRVCLVASEMLGAHKNGGIGTATSHLAIMLARHGHAVSLIYTGWSAIDYEHPWTGWLRNAGIHVAHLDWSNVRLNPIWLRESSAVYDYLRAACYDLIVFQDWKGVGFASIRAKRAGLSFLNTTLTVIAHGPTAWLLEANRALARTQSALAELEMERVCFAEADAVVCPSHHMREWLEAHRFELPSRTDVLPLFLWSDRPSAEPVAPPLDEVRTIAFFGRLEERKGIQLFLRAIIDSRLAYCDFGVVFLGKPSSLSTEDIRIMVAENAPWLLPRIRFEADFDTATALEYLVEHRCLAVIPSLVDNAPCTISECLQREIPFLAAATGGIPELVAPEDRPRVLFAPSPKALTARLLSLVGTPFKSARGRYEEGDVARAWLAWVERASVPAPPPPEQVLGGGGRSLAVVVTHFERPDLLRQALASLAAQTVTDFEVVLVDDGSESAEALNALDAIEQQPWPFSLKLLRQANSYLGAARNAAIRATRAQRLIFLDDDNLAFPTMVEAFDRAMDASGADIVTCQMAIFHDPAEEPDLDNLDWIDRWAFTGGSLELGLSFNCFGDATGIYERKVFERVGYFHERHGLGCEDWHLHARAALAGLDLISLPVPLYWYRRVPGTMLGTIDKHASYKLIWDAYRDAMPNQFSWFVDLAIRSDIISD